MNVYIEAYNAGVKLAELDYLAKVAKPQESREPESGPSVTSDESFEGTAPSGSEEPQSSSEGISPEELPTGSSFGPISMNRGGLSSGVTSLAMDPTIGLPSNPGQVAPTEQQSAPQQDMYAQLNNYLGGLAQQYFPQNPGAPVELGFNLPNYEPEPKPDAGEYPGLAEAGQGANYFNVVRGGYGKQFRALQDQFKQLGREDDLEGFTYRDMAQAMGNRGLRVADRFDANDLLQRMKNIQDQGMGAMEGTQFNVQRQQGRGKQRGYRDIGNFQSLQQQQAAGRRSSRAPGVQMTQLKRTPDEAVGRLPMVGGRPTPPAPSSPAPSSPAPSSPAPSSPAPSRPVATNTGAAIPPGARNGTFRTTDDKGGTTITTLNGMTREEGKNQLDKMMGRRQMGFADRAKSTMGDLNNL